MKAREFWLLFSPSLLIMSALLILPLARTVQWSFENVRYGTPGTFVGLGNFADALTDPRFHRAVIFTVAVTVVTTAILIVFGYLIATAVNTLRLTRPAGARHHARVVRAAEPRRSRGVLLAVR